MSLKCKFASFVKESSFVQFNLVIQDGDIFDGRSYSDA